MSQQDASYNTISMGLSTIVTDSYQYINDLIKKPAVIAAIVVILFVVLIVSHMQGASSSSTLSMMSGQGGSGGIITSIVVGILVVLVVLHGFQYLAGTNISTTISQMFTSNPELDIILDIPPPPTEPVPEIMSKKQVFNIPDNEFVYEDAKAICTAYGAELATYDQIEDSYKDGGEWCNYGWSANQMALFPTQKKTWDNLQSIDGHENDCGRPGINGGYIANPKVKFGANCYGHKPKMTTTEEDIMATTTTYPQTAKEKAMEQRVTYWKNNLTEVLVSPFNSTSWSRV